MAGFQSRNRGCLGVRCDMGRHGLARQPGGHNGRPVWLCSLYGCLLRSQSEVRSPQSGRRLVAVTGRVPSMDASSVRIGRQSANCGQSPLAASDGTTGRGRARLRTHPVLIQQIQGDLLYAGIGFEAFDQFCLATVHGPKFLPLFLLSGTRNVELPMNVFAPLTANSARNRFDVLTTTIRLAAIHAYPSPVAHGFKNAPINRACMSTLTGQLRTAPAKPLCPSITTLERPSFLHGALSRTPPPVASGREDSLAEPTCNTGPLETPTVDKSQ